MFQDLMSTGFVSREVGVAMALLLSSIEKVVEQVSRLSEYCIRIRESRSRNGLVSTSLADIDNETELTGVLNIGGSLIIAEKTLVGF